MCHTRKVSTNEEGAMPVVIYANKDFFIDDLICTICTTTTTTTT